MIFAFDNAELDTDRAELRRDGEPVPVEPQVYALLLLLVEGRDRLVTRDEIIEKVWNGRIVSEAAISSRIKAARQAVGDDGKAQRVIRTVHGKGLRFVASVRAEAREQTPAVVRAQPEAEAGPAERPGIAVLPFRLVGVADAGLPIADALPHDVITELSRLRWLFVIARASSFRFRGPVDLDRVRAELNVPYCLSGVVEVTGDNVIVSAELGDTRDRGVVWSERFRGRTSDIHDMRDQIVSAIVGALDLRIPLNEARRVQLRNPGSLDAWSAYHVGLQHMYRFTKDDNARALELFGRAASLDPRFARAHAGLSFVHFQNAFLGYSDRRAGAELSRRHASESLAHDPMDSFGHLTMGRALWLADDFRRSIPWLEQASGLNPNFAQARYSRSFAESMLGHAGPSRANVDAAMALSPLDPLLYGMRGVRAFDHLALDELAEAAQWAERAANSPGAHALIEMIAVAAHDLNGDAGRAREWAASAQRRAGARATFFQSFPLRQPDLRKRLEEALARHGF